MRIIKNIKDLFSLVKNVRQLEEDVENLETKILAPEEVRKGSFFDFYSTSLFDSLYGGSNRKISLEEKVDAIAKTLKLEFGWTEEKDKEVVARLPKKSVVKKGIKKK